MDSKRDRSSEIWPLLLLPGIFFFNFVISEILENFSNKIAKVVEFIPRKKRQNLSEKKITRLPEASFRFWVPTTVKKKHSVNVKKKRHFDYRNRNHPPTTPRKNRKSFITRSLEIIHHKFALYHQNLPPAMVKNNLSFTTRVNVNRWHQHNYVTTSRNASCH